MRSFVRSIFLREGGMVYLQKTLCRSLPLSFSAFGDLFLCTLFHSALVSFIFSRIIRISVALRKIFLIFKYAVHFNSICGLIEDGILQGFSDMSYVLKHNIDNKTNLLHVYECAISSVTLTPNPAVVKSQLEAMNATKFYFGKKEEEEKRNGIFGLNI